MNEKSPDEPSALDDIFHDSNFKEYEPEALIPRPPASVSSETTVAPQSARPSAALSTERSSVQSGVPSAAHTLSPTHRTLFWIAGGTIAAIILVILFVIGTKIAPPSTPAAAITPTTTSSSTPTPTPTPTSAVAIAPAGPVASGVHKWTELRGGECLSPYDTPWAETFTVVDCTTPHAAQLVIRAAFPPASAASSTSVNDVPWPGDGALAAQINLLCTAPGVIDLAVAGTYSDIQFQGSYAATAKEWQGGNHSYSCFVSRSSGQPLTASVAGTP